MPAEKLTENRRYNNRFTDEELVELSHNGDAAATEFLMDKYKDLVRNKARSMYLIGGESEDLIQEGMIGLFKAIRDYRPDRDAAFTTFAILCINRQLYSAVQAYSRKKHTPLNTAISLDDPQDPWPGADARALDPENELIDRENVRQLILDVDRLLSPLEKQVFELTITGISYTDIARILDKPQKSIDNARQRMRRKLKASLFDK